MLSISYSQALNDPTYCEDGVAHGRALAKRLGVKHNQPYPLKDILPYCTIPEFLWCLRAVKVSQKAEADEFANAFVHKVLLPLGWGSLADLARQNGAYTMPEKVTLEDRVKFKLVHTLTSRLSPSQAAIDISKAVVYYIGQSGGNMVEEEQRQRKILKGLLQ
jgi:hypothetical protein